MSHIINSIKEELFNDKSMYKKILTEFPDIEDVASFLREQYKILENLSLDSTVTGKSYGPYTDKQVQVLEMVFRRPLNTISKNLPTFFFGNMPKNVNSINILERKDQRVYLVDISSNTIDKDIISYFGAYPKIWSFSEIKGRTKLNVRVNQIFQSMCDIYGIDECESIEEKYKNNIDFFLLRGLKELYVLCYNSLLYRDRLVLDEFKLVQYNTTTLNYRRKNITPIFSHYYINKPKNILTYFDYINSGRKPPMIETVDGPISYYYLENEITGVKMLLLGDMHVRNKSSTCSTDEHICPVVDYFRIILDYATNVQNIVIDLFLESPFRGSGPDLTTRQFNDEYNYIRNINNLFSTCANVKNCKLQHRIHSVDVRPEPYIRINSEGFIYDFLTNMMRVLLDSLPKNLYTLIVSYIRAYPYLTNLFDQLINVEKFQKQFSNIRDKNIADKLLSILKSKYESVNLSYKEIMIMLCDDFINGVRSEKRHKLFGFFSEYQNSYFYARLFRDYNDTKGLYSDKPCNIIHHAGNSHIKSIKDELVQHFGYKIVNSQDENLTQCISLKEMKQPLFHNSICKNTKYLPVQEKNRSDISRNESFNDLRNATKRSAVRYDSKTLKIIKKIDCMYYSGFDEPFFYDFKYMNRILKEVPHQYKYIRTLFLAYGIQSTAYNTDIFKPLETTNTFKEIIEDFRKDPEVYIYPSIEVAFDNVKKGFIATRKAIRKDTNISSLRALALKWDIPKEVIKPLTLKQLKNVLLDKSDELYKIDYPFFTEEDKEYYKMIQNGSSLYLKTLAKALNLKINDIHDVEGIRSQLLKTVKYMLVK